ncbi:MAG: hypothetical protein Q8K21_01890 [Hydrogenophaga sp.]|uniref:hypothetical protein n=1 Tax=Hydrogenophaga sp. TaxID=1904254 RepID=UPI00273016A1|nr:hypothetical protein [Hydrogenophaga sp.]MDP2162973.1 hypothetical protein [Hydrogenophaga sp.]MDP3475686.1 hypothetical protein [Hydrogenophaga sp.]
MNSTNCVQSDWGTLWFRFCVDLLPELSFPILAQCHCGCSLNTFAPRFVLYTLLRLTISSSHAFAHVCVRSNVQMACPERAMPQAWWTLVGRQAAQDAEPPGHRRPVPSGRGKVQGKIEGSGTLPAHKRVCTWGWCGTRYWTAPCREVRQSLVGIGETACMARSGRMVFAGVSA